MLGYTATDLERMIDAIAIATDYLYDYRDSEEDTAAALNEAASFLQGLLATGHVQ